jgi:hypothetical protein
MGPTTLLSLRRKSCYGFLFPLKIHRPQPDFNPRIMGPIAVTLTTRTRRATCIKVKHEYVTGRPYTFSRLHVSSSTLRNGFWLNLVFSSETKVAGKLYFGPLRSGLMPTSHEARIESSQFS